MRSDIYAAINSIRRTQDAIHPQFPSFKRMSILAEEVGEVAEALNDDKSNIELIGELLDVAAVAIRWIETIQKEEADENKSVPTDNRRVDS